MICGLPREQPIGASALVGCLVCSIHAEPQTVSNPVPSSLLIQVVGSTEEGMSVTNEKSRCGT
jgi:hypothetical protein